MRPDIVQFEGFEYRREQQCLTYAGQRLKVGSRALALLGRLLEQPGVYVPASELLAAVWPDTHVEDSNLRVQVSGLRRHLGICGHLVIRNAPGRGYAFAGLIAGRFVRQMGELRPLAPLPPAPTTVEPLRIGRGKCPARSPGARD